MMVARPAVKALAKKTTANMVEKKTGSIDMSRSRTMKVTVKAKAITDKGGELLAGVGEGGVGGLVLADGETPVADADEAEDAEVEDPSQRPEPSLEPGVLGLDEVGGGTAVPFPIGVGFAGEGGQAVVGGPRK